MIAEIPNAVEREIDGVLYHVVKMPNAQAAAMLDKWGAVLQPVFAKWQPVKDDQEVVFTIIDRLVGALTSIGFSKLYGLAKDASVFCFEGDVPLKDKFDQPEWSGRWGDITKIVGAFLSVNFAGFSTLLPKGSDKLMQLLRAKVAEQFARQSAAAQKTISIGSSGDPSEKDGQPSTKSTTDGPSIN